MELILNIYKNKKDEKGNRIIEKTYKADSCDLLWGPIEEILGVLDLEKLETDPMKSKLALGKMILTLMGQIKPILKDVFFGLTDEELKMTSSKEVVSVVFGILQLAVIGIMSDENVKNLLGE